MFKGNRTEEDAGGWLSLVAWVGAISLAALAAFLIWNHFRTPANASAGGDDNPTESRPAAYSGSSANAVLPALQPTSVAPAVFRRTSLHTDIPNRPRSEVQTYTVSTGDSVFEIAGKFNIKPETVLWANYDLLNDSPDTISLGMDLQIPPVDGVYYQWQAGDTVESVAAQFEAKPGDILAWPGNNFDLASPAQEAGTWIMVPGGHREFRSWVIPTIPRGQAGVNTSVLGGGACDGGYEGAYGTGSFGWPIGVHGLSGNDYWEGHLAIDLGAGDGANVVAADSGVVVFSGGAYGGYGNMVMIDHGNGYQTLYAHLSSTVVGCGASVTKGGIIGYAGSTGNSTGTHLHFEVRYMGGFINPWHVLPAP